MTNAEILSSILAKWLRPMYPNLVRMGLLENSMAVQKIDGKIRSMGVVPSSWSIISDLSPYLDESIESIIKPMIHDIISEMPDDSIPEIVRGIVCSAYSKGGMSLLGGKLTFGRDSLNSLRNMLDSSFPTIED